LNNLIIALFRAFYLTDLSENKFSIVRLNQTLASKKPNYSKEKTKKTILLIQVKNYRYYQKLFMFIDIVYTEQSTGEGAGLAEADEQ